MEGVTIKYFNDLFQSMSLLWLFEEILTRFLELIMVNKITRLASIAIKDNVKSTLFMIMYPKNSGLDGMIAFFQQSWSVIEVDVVVIVNIFLHSKSFDKRLNITNIYLISKKG